MTTGQKVVCIDDKFSERVLPHYVALPKAGKVYTIRNVSIGCNINREPGEVCLLLVGIHNPRSSVAPFCERGFNSERFAPLEENESEQSESNVIEVDFKQPVYN